MGRRRRRGNRGGIEEEIEKPDRMNRLADIIVLEMSWRSYIFGCDTDTDESHCILDQEGGLIEINLRLNARRSKSCGQIYSANRTAAEFQRVLVRGGYLLSRPQFYSSRISR